MSSQRYERISSHDDDDSDPASPHTVHADRPAPIPSSPPPSFRSHASSPTSFHRLSAEDPLSAVEDRTLADTFDGPESDEEDGDGLDDRQRLMRADPSGAASEGTVNGNTTSGHGQGRPLTIERRVTQLPVFSTNATASRRVYGGGGTVNDGVFANLSAKPTRGEELDEKPPTYEQAAADATPPYWETTILAPGLSTDDVFIDGLPVGSIFSFIWNALISMSFQLVGFLLTYLLHTTHAAKNGSRAGLGITLLQFGFSMKGSPVFGGGGNGGSDPGASPMPGSDPSDPSMPTSSIPSDPTMPDFKPPVSIPESAAAAAAAADGTAVNISTSEWLSYMLMIVGWFILIRAISDFLRARRHEQLVMQSPDRGLNVPVVAEGERPETSV